MSGRRSLRQLDRPQGASLEVERVEELHIVAAAQLRSEMTVDTPERMDDQEYIPTRTAFPQTGQFQWPVGLGDKRVRPHPRDDLRQRERPFVPTAGLRKVPVLRIQAGGIARRYERPQIPRLAPEREPATIHHGRRFNPYPAA